MKKDHVFLQERFFYFLEAKREHGLLVMYEVEKAADRKFVRQREAYFTRTTTGRYRTAWIVPTPFFMSSDLYRAFLAPHGRLCYHASSTIAGGPGWP